MAEKKKMDLFQDKAKTDEQAAPPPDAPPPVVAPEAPPKPVMEFNEVDAKLGMDGFLRKGNRIIPAKIVVPPSVRCVLSDGKKVRQQILTVLYFSPSVHGYSDILKDVVVGLKDNCWWHDLAELQTAINVERNLTSTKPAANPVG